MCLSSECRVIVGSISSKYCDFVEGLLAEMSSECRVFDDACDDAMSRDLLERCRVNVEYLYSRFKQNIV